MEPPALHLARDLEGMFGAKLQVDPAHLPEDAQEAVVAVLLQARHQGLLPGHADGGHLERLARLFLANLAALHAYAPGPYRGNLTLLRAIATPGNLADNGWRGICGHALTVHAVPGDHFSLLRQPNVRALATTVNDCLHPPESEYLNG
jgi:thioesterase domain-containing protein